MRKLLLATILSAGAVTAAPAIAQPGPPGCPPGLAKKGCVPPGQYKKYEIGKPLPRDYGRYEDYRRYDLPPPRDGYYYSRVDREIVLVERATRNVRELVYIIDELTN